ncbi:hypothetical protein ANRL1_03228 [Anaerolineae bacterium]|nr:hypothetical protein ANRL1_03228 [Anaerolineae bacterium]
MANPAKHNKAWSKEEVALLKKLYGKKVVHREIAVQLKRTLNAVESKATELGLVTKKK